MGSHGAGGDTQQGCDLTVGHAFHHCHVHDSPLPGWQRRQQPAHIESCPGSGIRVWLAYSLQRYEGRGPGSGPPETNTHHDTRQPAPERRRLCQLGEPSPRSDQPILHGIFCIRLPSHRSRQAHKPCPMLFHQMPKGHLIPSPGPAHELRLVLHTLKRPRVQRIVYRDRWEYSSLQIPPKRVVPDLVDIGSFSLSPYWMALPREATGSGGASRAPTLVTGSREGGPVTDAWSTVIWPELQ